MQYPLSCFRCAGNECGVTPCLRSQNLYRAPPHTVRLSVEQTDSSTLCKTGGGGHMFDGFAILCNETVGVSCVRKTG